MQAGRVRTQASTMLRRVALLQFGMAGEHRARHAGGEDVGGADRQAHRVGGADGQHGDDFGRRALGIGELGLADLLADRAHDALPADHRAETQGHRHRELDPERNVVGERQECGAQRVQGRGIGAGHEAAPDQLEDAVIDQIDVAAQARTLDGRQFLHRGDAAQRRRDVGVLLRQRRQGSGIGRAAGQEARDVVIGHLIVDQSRPMALGRRSAGRPARPR